MMEEEIVHTDLGWTQAMPSRFMAARVGQFLTGHFPTGVYLHRFDHLPYPFYEELGIPVTCSNMLLACPRWAFIARGYGTGCKAFALLIQRWVGSLPLGDGISWWAHQEAGYGSDGFLLLCDPVGQCGTNSSLSLVTVRVRRIEVRAPQGL